MAAKQNGQGIWLYNAAIRQGSSDCFCFSDDYKIFALRDLKTSPLNEPSQRIQTSLCSADSPLLSSLQRLSLATDKHSEYVSCLGAAHAETTLAGTECHYCGDMSLSSLRSRLAFFSDSNSAPRVFLLFSSQGPSQVNFNTSIHFKQFFILCYFKAFEIIVSEHPIICGISLYIFPSPIKFLLNYVVLPNNVWNGLFYFTIQKDIYCITICGTLLPFLLNKGQLMALVFSQN